MIQRGEIWWADLPEPHASEPGFRRPVLVIQADAFTRSRIASVVVVAISSNLRLVEAPGNVSLTRRQSKLSRNSVVNVSQILTIDRKFLSERVGRVPPEIMAQIEAGLRLVLSL